ncbi:MAG: hypothetical protein Q9195_002743 [Heterodermia aff. obscurata]
MQTLPPELLINILDRFDVDLEKQELRNLRRTCWTLANLAAPYLFRKVSIWLERDSLHKLVGYSEHPLYSQCITHITLATDRLNPYIYKNTAAPCSGACAPYPWNTNKRAALCSGGCSSYPGNTREIKALYRRASATIDEEFLGSCYSEKAVTRAKRLVEHLEYQKRMEKEELDVVLLSKAMKKLPNLAHIVFDSATSPPECAQLSLDGFHILDPGSAWRRHVLQIGLKALTNAGSRPQSIVIINRDDWCEYHTPSWAFDDLDLIIPKTGLCALVQHLRIFCFAGTMEAQYSEQNSLHEGAIARFLENAHQLEQVALRVSGVIRGDTLRPLLGDIQYRRLREISLCRIETRKKELTSWLLMHSNLLEIIRLGDVTILQGDWVSFLDTMRPKPWPRLSHISLYKVDVLEPDGEITPMDWLHGSPPLVDYVQKKSHTNPYYVYHPGWFPELFGSDMDSN